MCGLNGLKHVKPLEQCLVHSQDLVMLTIFLPTTTIGSTTSVNTTTYHTEIDTKDMKMNKTNYLCLRSSKTNELTNNPNVSSVLKR